MFLGFSWFSYFREKDEKEGGNDGMNRYKVYYNGLDICEVIGKEGGVGWEGKKSRGREKSKG